MITLSWQALYVFNICCGPILNHKSFSQKLDTCCFICCTVWKIVMSTGSAEILNCEVARSFTVSTTSGSKVCVHMIFLLCIKVRISFFHLLSVIFLWFNVCLIWCVCLYLFYHRPHLDRTRESCQRPFLKAAGIEAAATAKRNRQNSLVSACASVCQDLLPTPSMTVLFRSCLPHGAKDRQGQQLEHAVPQVEAETPHKNVTQKANGLRDS